MKAKVGFYNVFLKLLVKYSQNINQSSRCLSTLPELSQTKYNTKRKNFNTVNNAHLTFFKNLLDENRVLTDADDVLPFNIDCIKNCRGQSQVVLKPKNVEEVSKILKFCNDNNLAICPQGGNTGLVGGSVPVFDEIVISSVLMNNIINIDTMSGVLVCEAGCVLEELNTSLENYNLMMPLDLGAKGTCNIGGNVSTNAGGLRLLRYGNLHGNVLGLEAVKANGEIIDCLNTLKKDNTGYHLKHLFIGSEGTLGYITKVSIQCPVLPKSVTLAFLGVNQFESVLKLYIRAKGALGEILSAFEVADTASLDCTVTEMNIINPVGDYPFYVLIETNGSDETHDSEKLNKFLETEMTNGLIANGTVTSESSKLKTLWALRDQISVAIMKDGYVYKYDISVPLTNFYDLIELMKERVGAEAVRVCGYGHIGDGNLHLNISTKQYDAEITKKIEPYVFEITNKLKGSVSAEHGIGYKKTKYLHFSKNNSCITLMKELKHLMDPKGILNPYKVLPD